MRLRQAFRENWDVGFIIVAMGLILGWALVVAVVLPILE